MNYTAKMIAMKDLKQTISYEDFARLDIRSATIIEAQSIEGSEKLIKLILDVGDGETRQVLAGIRKWYAPEDLKGKQIIFLANLEARKMMGEESQGMLLALDSAGEDKPILLIPEIKMENGSSVR